VYRGIQGQRQFYSCLLKLNATPRMFTFRGWVELTPKEQDQRVLTNTRVPAIAQYRLDGMAAQAVDRRLPHRSATLPPG
jgi:hypothetical protein